MFPDLEVLRVQPVDVPELEEPAPPPEDEPGEEERHGAERNPCKAPSASRSTNHGDVRSPSLPGMSARMYATAAITATFRESSVRSTLSIVSACVWW